MLEESNAFTMVLLDLSSKQTHLYTILRITDWQHWVFVIAQTSTGTLIFRQSDVHFEYVVISYLQLAN